MKPQCNTSADCLRELARVMDQFGVDDVIRAISSGYVKLSGSLWGERYIPVFSDPSDWQFAIAEVEGKPVFPYQEGLYCIQPSIKETFVPISYDQVNSVLRDASNWCISPEGLSWNPPKPAHVMVKLPWFVVEQYASCEGSYAPFRDDIRLACKTALEKLK